MARMRVRRLFCCLAILAMLPGCQFLPTSARAPEPDARIITDSAGAAPNGPNPYQKYFVSSEGNDLPQKNESKNPSQSAAPATSAQDARPSATGLDEIVVSTQLVSGRSGSPGQKPVTLQSNASPTLLPEFVSDDKKPDEYAPLVKALQCILEGRNQEAIQYLQAYDRDTQEFFLQLLPALTILVKTPLDKLTPPQVAVLNGQFEGIQQKLRPRSELIVSKMRYARRIYSFGLYDELPDNHPFLAGSKDRPGEEVLLYVELKNFASEPTREELFLTKLLVTLELKDSRGNIVWQLTYPREKTTHRRKARLNDFWSGYSFPMPDVAPGAYQLWIQIIDESIPEIRRVARKSLDFRVSPVAESAATR